MRDQLKKMGLGYAWSREVNTCLPEYYKWNQWIFLKMFERGLAYPQGKPGQLVPRVPDRPGQRTGRRRGVLAVRLDRLQKKMEQWCLKITDYADGCLFGHEALGKWPEHVLLTQKNSIGKSTGVDVAFTVRSLGRSIEVFTARVDTIYGATFLVLSPEHPMALDLVAGIAAARRARGLDRQGRGGRRTRRKIGDDEKEGIDTGAKAVNPFTGDSASRPGSRTTSSWITGRRHHGRPGPRPAGPRFRDEVRAPDTDRHRPRRPGGRGPRSGEGLRAARRPREFRPVRRPSVRGSHGQDGRLRRGEGLRPPEHDLPYPRLGHLPPAVLGNAHSHHLLPEDGVVGVPYEDLPVEIPYDVAITGAEGSPLERAEGFVNTTCPKCGGKARRETDTMDTFVDSSWYFFRYASPHEESLPFRPEAREVLAPGRSLHRRRRARHPPPHLRPVLHQGPPGPRPDRYLRAVPPLPRPGHGHQGRLRHVQVEGEHRRSRRDPREVRRRRPARFHPLRLAPGEGVRLGGGRARGVPPVPASRLVDGPREPGPVRGARGLAGGRRPGRGPAPEDPPDHPQGHRGHRGPLPPEHGRELHHGALQHGPEGQGRAAGRAPKGGRSSARPSRRSSCSSPRSRRTWPRSSGRRRATRISWPARRGPSTIPPWPGRRSWSSSSR